MTSPVKKFFKCKWLYRVAQNTGTLFCTL